MREAATTPRAQSRVRTAPRVLPDRFPLASHCFSVLVRGRSVDVAGPMQPPPAPAPPPSRGRCLQLACCCRCCHRKRPDASQRRTVSQLSKKAPSGDAVEVRVCPRGRGAASACADVGALVVAGGEPAQAGSVAGRARVADEGRHPRAAAAPGVALPRLQRAAAGPR